MRTDCTRDTKVFQCPNLVNGITLSTWEVRPGDFVEYKEHYTDSTFRYRTARAIGRVHCEGKTYLEVVAFSHTCRYGYVRWLKAEDISEIAPGKEALEFLAKVTRPEPPKIDGEGWPI